MELDEAKLDAVATTVRVYFFAKHSKVVGWKRIIKVGNPHWFVVPRVATVRRWYPMSLNEDLSNISRNPILVVGPFAFLAINLEDLIV